MTSIFKNLREIYNAITFLKLPTYNYHFKYDVPHLWGNLGKCLFSLKESRNVSLIGAYVNLLVAVDNLILDREACNEITT